MAATYYISNGIISSGLILCGNLDYTHGYYVYDKLHLLPDGSAVNTVAQSTSNYIYISSGG